MIRNLGKIGVRDSWSSKIIQGYFARYKEPKNGFKYCLLSRRSWQKGGTRFNSRGLNESGYVANYVETEQFVAVFGKVCSYLQVRGSPPLFWKQSAVTSPAVLTKTIEFARKYYEIHFDHLNELAECIHCVNLVSKTKSGEVLLADSFKSLIDSSDRKNLSYEHIDFHQVTDGTNFSALNEFVLKSKSFIEHNDMTILEFEIDNYPVDTKHCYVHSTQKAIVRTNCVDCLDRTNAYQTKIGFLALILLDGVNKFEPVGFSKYELSDIDKKANDEFIWCMKNIWADNGDYISTIYTGTGATTSSTTRSGSSGLLGLLDHKMKSIGRFYLGNFEDNSKQKAINLIIGEQVVSGVDEHLEQKLKYLEKPFTKKQNIRLGLLSWCSYVDIGKIDKNLIEKLLSQLDLENLEVLVFGVQEAIKQGGMSSLNMFSTDVKTIALKYEHELNCFFSRKNLKMKKYTNHWSKGRQR